MTPNRRLLSLGIACFGLRICCAADIPAGVPPEVQKEIEKLREASSKPWVEAAEHWSCTIKMDQSESKHASVLVEMKNITGSERFLVSSDYFTSYEFLWKGKKPEWRPECAGLNGRPVLVRVRRLYQFAGPNEIVPDEIPLANLIDLKPGVAYTLRIKRFLDESNVYMKYEDRPGSVSNEITFTAPR